jgi:hypothetical protein
VLAGVVDSFTALPTVAEIRFRQLDDDVQRLVADVVVRWVPMPIVVFTRPLKRSCSAIALSVLSASLKTRTLATVSILSVRSGRGTARRPRGVAAVEADAVEQLGVVTCRSRGGRRRS